MSFQDDDDLLAALGRAVGPDPAVRPSDAERADLRRAVLRAASGDTGTSAPMADVVPISTARRLRTRVLVGSAAVVIGLSGATAVAAAVNDGALPAPVRVVVHAVGLPVDSVEVAQAKDALRRLRTATDTEVTDALARAERELADLTPSERAGLGDDVDRTLAEARERLARVEAAAAAATSTAATSTAPTTPTAAPATVDTAGPPTTPSQPSTGTSTATSVDDHGGGTDGSSPDVSSPDSSDDRGGGDGSGGSTATSDDSGKGGSGGGGDDGSSAPTSPGDTTATTDDSGRNRGGDDSSATSDGSGKGSGGGGGSGGG
jgi:hypothetical protein